jgi:hypothetical protein
VNDRAYAYFITKSSQHNPVISDEPGVGVMSQPYNSRIRHFYNCRGFGLGADSLVLTRHMPSAPRTNAFSESALELSS